MADVKLRMEIDPTAQSDDDRYYVIDKFNGMKSISSTSQSITDGSSIQYGILPNTGSAEAIDVDGSLATLIKEGHLLDHDVNCDLFLNGRKFQHHLTSDSDYYEDKILRLKFKDSLSSLSEREFSGMPLCEHTTAFGVLSYIFYKMGGYPLENVATWTKYRNPDTITFDGYDKNDITVNTQSGCWEIVGFPIDVVPNKEYTLSLAYEMDDYTPLGSYNGIALQILNSYPQNNNNSSNSILTEILYHENTYDVVHMTFTPTTDKVYFAINFGYAADNQTINMHIEDILLSYDDKYNALSGSLWDDMILNDGSIGRVLDHLKSIKIEYPYLTSSTFADAINKVCEIAQLNCIEDEDGYIKFVPARPLISDEYTAVHIPRYAQETFPKDSLFIKNKITSVKTSYNETTLSRDDVGSFSFDFKQEYTNSGEPIADPTSTIENPPEGYSFVNKYTIDGINYVWDMYQLGFYDEYTYDISSSVLCQSWDWSTALPEEQSAYGRKFELSFKLNSTYFKEFSSYDEYLDTYFDKSVSGNQTTYTLKSTYVHTYNGFVSGLVRDGASFKIYTFIRVGYIDNGVPATFNGLSGVNIRLSAKNIKTSLIESVSASSDYEFAVNELVQDNTTCNGEPIINVLEKNVLKDYKDGIKTTTLRIKLMDFNSEQGLFPLNYKNGRIPQVGGAVIIDEDNYGNSLFKYDEGTPVVWKIVGRTVDFSGVPTMTLELQQVRRSFASMTWADISALASGTNATNFFSIGEEKIIHPVVGYDYTVKIIGMYHDELSNGASCAGITVNTKNVDEYLTTRMNSSATANWGTSEMREETLPDIYDYLTPDIQSVVKSVVKYTSLGGDPIDTQTTTDTLWLLSAQEILGDHAQNLNEGSQYKYWEDHMTAEDRIKKGSYEAQDWWLRSPYAPSSTQYFRYINTSGNLSYADPRQQHCISFCFCVGNGAKPFNVSIGIIPNTLDDIGGTYDNVLDVKINGESVPYNDLPKTFEATATGTIAFYRKSYYPSGSIVYSLESPKVNGTTYSWGTSLDIENFKKINFSASVYSATPT